MKKIVTRSRKLTLLAASISAAFGLSSQSSYGQSSDSVVVTGSRLQGVVSSSAPLFELSAQDIKATGITRVEELLNSLPQLVPDYGAFDVNPGTGQASINLRGLGSQRTLVLVNGHRMQPGGLRDEAPDLNQIPVAMVKRIEILTGGASAIYGSDAMAGVVNIILDDEFQGFSASVGKSAYQHKNRNGYLPPLMDARGFKYPNGSSGFDGKADTLDLAWGGKFDGGRGHASAYFAYRENDALLQGARDYTSCALNVAGTACGGSGTAPNPSFLIFGTKTDGTSVNGTEARIGANGRYVFGLTDRYNFAPINHFQIPNQRYHFGNNIEYRFSEQFSPYFQSMVTSSKTSLQIAESGTFYNHDGVFSCAQMGTLCADLGLDPSKNQEVYVGKRNVEGGPRVSNIDSTSFRIVSGAKGQILQSGWDYNVSYLLGRNRTSESNVNDFVTTRLDDALRACPDGSFKGCIPYNVWAPNGVTTAAAAALSASGLRSAETTLKVFSAFVSRDTALKLPAAKQPVSVGLGFEQRQTGYTSIVDENMATGKFTGLGGARTPITGEVKVNEVFGEAAVPLYSGTGQLKSFIVDLGVRSSDYDRSGRANTFKIGSNANFGPVRVRASYNSVIRAASVSDLFQDQVLSLFTGTDPCAGSAPTRSAAECALTGVTAAQYGKIPASPASQYNQFGGGNTATKPEKGNTVTLGFVFTPAKQTAFSVDYFRFDIEDKIGTVGASTIINQCISTGDPFLCSKIKRRPGSGDLWVGSDPSTSGYVVNTTTNLGSYLYSGLDLSAFHAFSALNGRISLTAVGTRMLDARYAPLPGLNEKATYDCVGKISPNCSGIAKWKHVATVRYARDSYTVSLRWRHFQGYDYVLTDGKPGVQDQLVAKNYGGRLPGSDYLDASALLPITKSVNLTVGINNLTDRPPVIVGDGLAATSNVPSGGYDPVGRYLFANLGVKF